MMLMIFDINKYLIYLFECIFNYLLVNYIEMYYDIYIYIYWI